MSIMNKICAAAMLGFICVGALAQPGFANPVQQRQGQVVAETDITSIVKILKINDVIDVMRLEGLSYGTQMEAELFPDKGGGAWASMVGLIYDSATMRGRFEMAFAQQIAGHEGDLAAIEAFFGSDLGQRILTLEIEARRSLMDEAVEDAAKANVEDMIAKAVPRAQALEDFSAANDLIEMNIAGALNSNLAFYQGMSEVGTTQEAMTSDEMLADVWAQEPDIRAETESWVLPYLALSYGSLSDDEMAAYIAFSKTEPGQTLNLALFGAFDVMFSAISRDLGRAAAKQMMGQDI